MDNTVVMADIRRLCRSGPPCAGAEAFPADSERHCNGFPAGAEGGGRAAPWRPLVLLIPLRLGLADVNAAYAGTLKHCFRMPQSLGVIGGKPNSAHYFIGYVGEELIYLDPHTTQPAVAAADRCLIPDESFHCQHPPGRMSITELDPSIAVGFFCKTEDDFNDWCQQVRKILLTRSDWKDSLTQKTKTLRSCPSENPAGGDGLTGPAGAFGRRVLSTCCPPPSAPAQPPPRDGSPGRVLLPHCQPCPAPRALLARPLTLELKPCLKLHEGHGCHWACP